MGLLFYVSSYILLPLTVYLLTNIKFTMHKYNELIFYIYFYICADGIKIGLDFKESSPI